MDSAVKENGGADTGEESEDSQQVDDQFEEPYEVMGQEQCLMEQDDQYLDMKQDQLVDVDGVKPPQGI